MSRSTKKVTTKSQARFDALPMNTPVLRSADPKPVSPSPERKLRPGLRGRLLVERPESRPVLDGPPPLDLSDLAPEAPTPAPAPAPAPRTLTRRDATHRRGTTVTRGPVLGPRAMPPLPAVPALPTSQSLYKDVDDAVRALTNTLKAPTSTAEQKLAAVRTTLSRCYAWFNAQHVHGWDTLSAADKDLETQVRATMAALEARHADLVGEAPPTSDGAPMVFSPTVTPADQATARALWKRIARGDKPLRLLGSVTHQGLVRSRLVRLLETTTGIRLLDGLMSGERPVVITDERIPEKWLALVANAEATGPAARPIVVAAPLLGEADPVSPGTRDDYAEHLATMGGKIGLEAFRPAHAAVDIIDAVADGERGIMFKLADGTNLRRPFGPGALGTVVNLGPSEDSRADENGESVHTPQWITLGGLLGAGLRQIRGAVVDDDPDEFANFTIAPPDFEARWRSPEAFVGIESVDNPLRREVDLRTVGQLDDARDPTVKARRDAALKRLNAAHPPRTEIDLLYRLGVLRRREETLAREPDDQVWERWSAEAEKLLDDIDRLPPR